jgi:regulator of sirC expression with transglutaminase-like and TPR domain
VSCARYKEAINECSAALELNPNYTRALIRRAKAYEQMQHYKQALSDLQKINRGEDATPDTRVRSLIASVAVVPPMQRNSSLKPPA